MNDKKQVMIIMYDEAKKYLKEICPKGVNINKYFNIEKTFKSKSDILYTLLSSLQDRQIADNVIGFLRPERQEIFKKILYDYDIDMILSNYDENSLLVEFNRNFTINNIASKNNLWRLYAKSVISSANFLNQFNSVEDFERYVDIYKGNPIDLPVLLQSRIFGLGFALACHFLKDLGYSNYAKPDVHIKEVFMAFSLSTNDEQSVFNAVAKMAEVVNDSAFNIDRLFWLICSGYFYDDNIRVGRHKEDFIHRVKEIINNNENTKSNLSQISFQKNR